MINLIIILFATCTSLGIAISKTTNDFGYRKQRQHTTPLKLDKEIF